MLIRVGRRVWERAECAQAGLVRAAGLRSCAYLLCTGNTLTGRGSPKAYQIMGTSVAALVLSDVRVLMKLFREN